VAAGGAVISNSVIDLLLKSIIFVLKIKAMTTVELKNNFHHLIDSIDNDSLLQRFYELMSRKSESVDGSLWNRLTIEEQEELLSVESEINYPNNLISHDEMKKRHSKWL
jgi:hypothetical protein